MGGGMWLTIEHVLMCALWQQRLWGGVTDSRLFRFFFNGVPGAAHHPPSRVQSACLLTCRPRAHCRR